MAQPRDRGLQQVPRGLSREMTLFLQNMRNIVLSLSGLGQNTESRAVRADDDVVVKSSSAGNAALTAGSVMSGALATDAVTADKIANNAVTTNKIADNAIATRHVQNGSITQDKLAQDAVPVVMSGSAQDGQTVDLGAFQEQPMLALQSFSVGIPEDAQSLTVNVIGPWKDDTDQHWKFSVNCQVYAKEPENNKSGGIKWVAMGRVS